MKLAIERDVQKPSDLDARFRVHITVTVGDRTLCTVGLGSTEDEADAAAARSFAKAGDVLDRYSTAIAKHNRFDWEKAVR
jgi:hypothetical protein